MAKESSKFAPMFNSVTDENGVAFSSNAHPETEYEHHARLKTRFGDNKTGISSQAFGQVFRQEAARVGGMSFNSVLRKADPGEVQPDEIRTRHYDED
jgi:hypothetical protein